MNKTILFTLLGLLFLSSCNKEDISPLSDKNDNSLNAITQRNFKMGFSTWSSGPNEADNEETYQFIDLNADIYSEQIDDKIPWKAWMNNSTLPTEFTDEINQRVSNKLNNHKLLLSVSLLNTDRSDLLEDYDGAIPNYTSLNDANIENAYFKHLDFLISKFNPDYLVIAMEVNELKLHSESKWTEYKLLMDTIRSRLKIAYPNLPLSESITLHDWFNPEVANPTDFISEISNYVNQHLDYAAISYYPFFKGQRTKSEFQQAFDFLHSEVSIPIAFVETTHLAENLNISSFNLSIESNVYEQKEYLETLSLNAHSQNYEFIIWWAYRDYDKLWETFPPEYKDVGKLWRDTGLLDENGTERPSFTVWNEILDK
ncbi:hypothetical protein [Zobellia uliginosa]|uniref:hypothetical protein n=1 Tax=Zobellia uliginosa TaxID=143224 RepID=UPI0026E42E8D|nr:hypothetical protein [Zobellia uliginosa]MDO6517726.1 hypothetical protein [Zobellia uliginosa]